MKYVILPTNKDICHSLHGNHKYIEKVRTSSGKWRYIYTKPKGGIRYNADKLGFRTRKYYKEAAQNTTHWENIVKDGIKSAESNRRDRLINGENKHNSYADDRYNINIYKGKLAEAQRIEDNYFKQYRNTLLGKAESSYKAGLEILSYMFGDIFKKKK